MKSFVDINVQLAGQPPRLGALLSKIDVAKGNEAARNLAQPMLLASLATQTRFQSIQASTALEGINVAPERAHKIAEPGARARNRNEREFAGYRDAVDELMSAQTLKPISVAFILHLHRTLYSANDGRGGYLKTTPNIIIERDASGKSHVIFTPPAPDETEFLLTELVDRYNHACDVQAAHPLVLLSAFVLDLLAIHPVADGNGRLARLLTTHELLRNGYGVARYVSIEQRIFDTKHSYYAALRASQLDWNESRHNVWPWTEYLCGVLGHAYDTLETRLAASAATVGMNKQALVRAHVLALSVGEAFKIRDLRTALPGISDQTLRLVLSALKAEGLTMVDGTGPGARWTRLDG